MRAHLGGCFAVAMVAVAACGGGDDTSGDPDGGPDGGDVDADGLCERVPGDPDQTRRVVVSLPYDAAGGQASTYEVLTLDAAGELTAGGARFAMGRSTIGTIRFTADGRIGMVAQEDGTIGVFRLDAAGAVTVVHAAFAGDFYAEDVVIDPFGFRAYVVDPDWRENGGGIYRVAIGCDGTLTDGGLWVAAKSPHAFVLRGGAAASPTRALLVAADVLASPAGDDVHWLDVSGATPVLLDGADAFGDDDAIAGGVTVTAGGAHVLIGDTSQFSGVPNRVAVVGLAGDTLTPAQVLTPLEDPLSLVASPLDDTVLAVSGFGDAFYGLGYTPQAATPFSLGAQVAYAGAPPELPGHAVMIDRGSLRGLALVAENLGVRRVRFAGGGVITDLGKTSTGTGYERIVGAIGVQP
jgi:hypothetical protein